MAGQLICNFPTCGKVVQDLAWITSCSHVFCVEHGEQEFTSKRTNKCPLCVADLLSQLDVVKADIQPSEQYKSMILAGQRPEVVMEMACRALALWQYQMQLQSSHEKQERLSAERKSQEVVAKITQEKTTLEMDLNNCRKDMDELQKKKSEVENSLEEKTRQNHKLTAQLDSLRCRMSDQEVRQQREVQMDRNINPGSMAPRLGFLNTNPGIRPTPTRQPAPRGFPGPVSAWNLTGTHGPAVMPDYVNRNIERGHGGTGYPAYGNMPDWNTGTNNQPASSGHGAEHDEAGNPTPAFVLNF